MISASQIARGSRDMSAITSMSNAAGSINKLPPVSLASHHPCAVAMPFEADEEEDIAVSGGVTREGANVIGGVGVERLPQNTNNDSARRTATDSSPSSSSQSSSSSLPEGAGTPTMASIVDGPGRTRPLSGNHGVAGESTSQQNTTVGRRTCTKHNQLLCEICGVTRVRFEHGAAVTVALAATSPNSVAARLQPSQRRRTLSASSDIISSHLNSEDLLENDLTQQQRQPSFAAQRTHLATSPLNRSGAALTASTQPIPISSPSMSPPLAPLVNDPPLPHSSSSRGDTLHTPQSMASSRYADSVSTHLAGAAPTISTAVSLSRPQSTITEVQPDTEAATVAEDEEIETQSAASSVSTDSSIRSNGFTRPTKPSVRDEEGGHECSKCSFDGCWAGSVPGVVAQRVEEWTQRMNSNGESAAAAPSIIRRFNSYIGKNALGYRLEGERSKRVGAMIESSEQRARGLLLMYEAEFRSSLFGHQTTVRQLVEEWVRVLALEKSSKNASLASQSFITPYQLQRTQQCQRDELMADEATERRQILNDLRATLQRTHEIHDRDDRIRRESCVRFCGIEQRARKVVLQHEGEMSQHLMEYHQNALLLCNELRRVTHQETCELYYNTRPRV